MKAGLWLAPFALVVAVVVLPIIIRAGHVVLRLVPGNVIEACAAWVLRLVPGNLTEACTAWSVSLLGGGRVRSPFSWAGVVPVHAVCPRSAVAGGREVASGCCSFIA
jgi:hypothetical protein